MTEKTHQEPPKRKEKNIVLKMAIEDSRGFIVASRSRIGSVTRHLTPDENECLTTNYSNIIDYLDFLQRKYS